MAIELSGRMDNIRDIGSSGKKFGLRISTKNKKTDEYESAWVTVVVWEDADGFEVVHKGNEKERVTIVDAYPKANVWTNREGVEVKEVEFVCSSLHLGYDRPNGDSSRTQSAQSAPPVADDENPF